jgi:hypothetical protein
MVAHSLPLSVMLDDIFQKRESCHNAWRGLRMTPLFGCICPNSPHKKKCDRVYNVVYNNSCLGEFNVPHPAPSSCQFRSSSSFRTCCLRAAPVQKPRPFLVHPPPPSPPGVKRNCLFSPIGPSVFDFQESVRPSTVGCYRTRAFSLRYRLFHFF